MTAEKITAVMDFIRTTLIFALNKEKTFRKTVVNDRIWFLFSPQWLWQLLTTSNNNKCDWSIWMYLTEGTWFFIYIYVVIVHVYMFISFICISLYSWAHERNSRGNEKKGQAKFHLVFHDTPFFICNPTISWLHWESYSFSAVAFLRLKVALALTHIQHAKRAFIWWENHISQKQFKRIRLQFISMKLQDGGRSISQALLLSLHVVSICITQIASRWEPLEHCRFLSPAGFACGEVTISKCVW